MANTYHYKSTTPRPSTATEDSILREIDTEDEYRYNQYGRWELIPHLSLKSKRLHTLFIPFSDQTGLIFGNGVWQNINGELHNSGCMIYQVRTLTTEFDTADSRGFMGVLDFALASMLPKVQMIFSFNDTGTNSAAFIGLKDDSDPIVMSTGSPFPDTIELVGIGYRTADTNIQVIHNDGVGATNYIDTAIPRSTSVFMIEIEYHTATSVRITLFDINMEVIYDNILTTEIPPDGIDLGFTAVIQNANASIRYVINMFDYVRLEKTKPALSATTDF